MLAINKADGDNLKAAARAAADYRNALALLQPNSANWQPPVITISGRENTGLDALWDNIAAHNARLSATGELAARRAEHAVRWMYDMLSERLLAAVHNNPTVAAQIDDAEQSVRDGSLAPSLAVDQILAKLGGLQS
jgi:LAO/AO transport system kinase